MGSLGGPALEGWVGRDRGSLVLEQHVPRSRDSIHPFTPKMSVRLLLGNEGVAAGRAACPSGKEFGLSPRNLERPGLASVQGVWEGDVGRMRGWHVPGFLTPDR